MESDMVLALSSATGTRQGLFGHNGTRPAGERQSLHRLLGRFPEPGEAALTSAGPVRQPQQTFTVLGCRSGAQWGFVAGCNEHGLAVGHSQILACCSEYRRGLLGPDLVRLLLERSRGAEEAISMAGELILHHGIGQDGESLFVIADADTGYLLIAFGRHFEIEKTTSRSVINHHYLSNSPILPRLPEALLRAPVDRPEKKSQQPMGLLHQSSPEDRLGKQQRVAELLEKPPGRLDLVFLRQLLADHQESISESNQSTIFPPAAMSLCHHAREDEEPATAVSLAMALNPGLDQFRLLWVAFGPPCLSLYFPIIFEGELPSAFQSDGLVWKQMQRLLQRARIDPGYSRMLKEELKTLQNRLDGEAQECLEETGNLLQMGNRGEAIRLASAFMQHAVERFEDLARHQLNAEQQRLHHFLGKRLQEQNSQLPEL